MENYSEIFRVALLYELDKAPRGTRARIAEYVGITAGRLADYLNGRVNTTEEIRREIADFFGYSSIYYDNFMQLGRALMAGKSVSELKPISRSTLIPANSIPVPVENGASIMTDEEMDQLGFIRVPYSAKMELAAGERGSCIPVTEDEYTSNIVVHGPSLGHHSAKHLQAFKVGGDSMEPVLAQNSIILADTKQNDIRHIRERRIYVVCYDLDDGACSVKYLRWVKGEKGKWLSIESANDFYAVEIRRVEDVALIGKVIWAWRSFPD